MAEQTQDVKGFLSATDTSKLPLYGEKDERIQELLNAQKAGLKALEQRYAQPNWFKIAAGFAKPQLGGFTASLGSASEALGDWVEQQRAQELPIAEMRARIAQNQMLVGQNKTVSDMLAERKASGKPITAEFVREIVARAPESPVAKSLQAELTSQQTQQQIALQRIGLARQMGIPPNPADLEFLKSSTVDQKPTEKPTTPSAIYTGTKGSPQQQLLQIITIADPEERKKAMDAWHERYKGGIQETAVEKPTVSGAPKEEKPVLPIDPTKDKPVGQVNWGFASVPQSASTEPGQKTWGEKEKSANARLAVIDQFGNPENNMSYRQPIQQILDYAQQSPENMKSLNRVTNVLSKFPAVVNGLLHAAEQGVHANWGDLHASIGLPVEKFMSNFNDPKDQEVAQMVTQAIAGANLIQSKFRGMSATANIPASEAAMFTAGTFSRNLGIKSLLYGFSQLENGLDMYSSLHNGSQYLLSTQGENLSPIAPTWQIVNSDWYKNAVNHYSVRQKNYSDKYNKSIRGKKEQ